MKVYAMTDVGRVRPINEDSFYLPQENERFCAVADGMGGHNAGEVASALAVETFGNCMRHSERLNATAIHDAVVRANEAVFDEGERDNRKNGMGTTFTALCRDGDTVHIAHVGDSRAYLIRNGAIMRVTVDHTLVEEMVLQGVITPREAKNHPKRNYITRALGTFRHVEVDLVQLDLRENDVFLLCSDGLSNHVEERQMLSVTLSQDGWQEKLSRLVNIALEEGGPDNITAMYVTFKEEHE
ncbi:MAG: Stp1/IreP family PP2C-type Ser/Thr phosphatase [Clostridia bacterium]|nr:Stp1/IreP family PP2C-type Ser/Thr phosphatase [Clostridia bacterium]